MKTMGVNITTIAYLLVRVLIIKIGSTIILILVEAQGKATLEIIEGYYLPTVLLSHLLSCRLYGEKSTFRLQAQVFVATCCNVGEPRANPQPACRETLQLLHLRSCIVRSGDWCQGSLLWCPRKIGSMVRINGLFIHIYPTVAINGVYWGYNPLTVS